MVTLKLDIARLLFISVHSHLFSYLEIICHPEIYELRLKRVFFFFKADVRLKIPSKIFRINLRLCVSNQREFLSFLSRGLKSKWSLSIEEFYVKIKKKTKHRPSWTNMFDLCILTYQKKKVLEMENGCGIELCPCKNACEAKNRCNLHIYNDLFEK